MAREHDIGKLPKHMLFGKSYRHKDGTEKRLFKNMLALANEVCKLETIYKGKSASMRALLSQCVRTADDPIQRSWPKELSTAIYQLVKNLLADGEFDQFRSDFERAIEYSSLREEERRRRGYPEGAMEAIELVLGQVSDLQNNSTISKTAMRAETSFQLSGGIRITIVVEKAAS